MGFDELEAAGNGKGEVGEGVGAVAEDFLGLVGVGEDDGGQPGEVAFVGGLGPGAELAEGIEAEGAEDVAGEGGDAVGGVVVEEDTAEGVDGEVVAAAGIAEEVAPAAGAVLAAVFAAGDGGAGAGDDGDAIA